MGTLIPTVLPQINHYSLLYLNSKSLTTNISRVCVTYIIVGVSLVFLCQLRSFGSSEAEEQSELTLLNLVAQNLQLTCALELLQLFICQLLHKQLYSISVYPIGKIQGDCTVTISSLSMHYFMYVCLYSSDTDLVGYSLVQNYVSKSRKLWKKAY